jgi:prephenate dehydratase
MPLPRVGYLGPTGTFSEEALLASLGGEVEPVECAAIEEVLERAEEGSLDLGFVPIENALEGSVHATLDALVHRHALLAVGEAIAPIQHHLIGLPDAELGSVRRVLSHPQALAQTRRHRRALLGDVEEVATTSTAEAARLVVEGHDTGTAAVGPRRAAEHWGLSVLAEHLEDDPHNETRFWLVARDRLPPPTGSDRTAVACFQVEDRPGSLLSLLTAFAARGLNLTHLESRPTRESLGSYLFVIELEGHVTDPLVASALVDLREHGVRTKLLGSFPAARPSRRAASKTPSLQVVLDPSLPRPRSMAD